MVLGRLRDKCCRAPPNILLSAWSCACARILIRGESDIPNRSSDCRGLELQWLQSGENSRTKLQNVVAHCPPSIATLGAKLLWKLLRRVLKILSGHG